MIKPHSNPHCPSCDYHITQQDINITEGVALCSKCGQLSQLSELNYLRFSANGSVQDTPKQVHLVTDREQIKIKISLFSIFSFLGSLFVAVFWCGITSVFLSLAVAAVCYNTIGYVPDWLPVPGLEDGKPCLLYTSPSPRDS